MTAMKVLRTLKMTQFAAFTLLALTSTVMLNSIAQDFFTKHLGDYPIAAGLCTIATVFGVLAIIDFGLKTFLPYIFVELLGRDFFKPAKKRVRMLVYILIGVSFFQILATTSLTYMSADDVVNAVEREPDDSNVTKSADLQSKNLSRSLSAYDEQITELRRTEKQRIKDAKSESKRLVGMAMSSKGRKMLRLYDEGNEWARGQLRSAREKAENQGAELVREAKNALPSAIAERAAYVAKQSAVDAAVLTPLAERSKTEFDDYQNRKQQKKTLFRYAAIVFVLILIVSTLCISIITIEIEENPHGDQTHTSIRASLSRYWKRVRENYAHRIDNKLQAVAPVTYAVTADPVTAATTPKHLSGLDLEIVTPSRVTPKKTVHVAPEALPVTAKNVTIVMRDKHPIYLHDTGTEVKPLTLKDVGGNVRTYRKRVKETLAFLQKNPDNPAKKEVLQNRKNMLAFWEAVREKMNNFS